jgi:CheY-like chemotaxis protein
VLTATVLGTSRRPAGTTLDDQLPAPEGGGAFTFDPGLADRVPHRILVVDDTAFNVTLAVRLLARFGYDAQAVTSGPESIEALGSPAGADLDLVLMDVQMPELDGFETTRRIRSLWPDRTLRIVAMTASAMEGDREACLAAGMDDYLSKPIRPQALGSILGVASVAEGISG